MFFFSRRKKKKDHDNIEDVVEKVTDEENLKGEISVNSEKDETYEKKDDGIRKQVEQEMLTQDKPVTTGKTDAIRFVRNNCEAIAENERQIAEAKKEYEKVTSYLTDIQRIDMQHELLMAVASQMISLKNIPNLTEVISIVSDNMETSLTAENMLYYAKEFLKLDSENIKFYTMPGDTGGNVFGASYVFCDIDAWLDMVNECLNPWEAQVTTENVNIVTYKDGNFYSTTGELSGGVSSFLNYSSSSTMGVANVYTYTSSPSTTNSGSKDDNE